MGNYRDNRGGGGRSFGRRSFGSDRGTDRSMTKTTCSNCGKECEVPFKPTGGKPVYCNECFKSRGGSDSRRSDDRGPRRSNYSNSDRGPAQPQYREQFEMLNSKLDEILKLMGRTTPPKKPKAPKPGVEVETISPESIMTEPEIPQASPKETVAEEV